MMHWRWIVSMCAVAVVITSAAMAEEIDNPTYQQWHKFKPGASSKYKMTMNQGGMEMTMQLHTTLKSLDDAQAVLAMQATMQMMGQSQTMPAQEQAVPAKIEKDQVDPIGSAVSDPKTEKGEETLDIAGQKLDCTWHKLAVEKEGMKLNGKVWTCEKVPGSLVKMESTVEGAQGGGTQKMELIEYTAE